MTIKRFAFAGLTKAGSLQWALAIFTFATVGIFCLYKSFFGISVADEAVYTALADLPRIGGVWLVNDKTIQLTTAVLFAPIVSLYTWVFGTEALTLFMRFLYLAASFATAAVIFGFFRRRTSGALALFISSIFVLFVPYSMACLNYNTMSYFLFAAGTMSLLDAFENHRRGSALLSGFCWVLCVYAYPTALALFFISSAFFYWRFSAQINLRNPQLTTFLASLVLTAIPLLAILLWLGPRLIIEAAEYSKPFNMPGQSWKIPYSLWLYGTYLPPWWMTVPALVAWLVAGRYKPEIAKFFIPPLLIALYVLSSTSEGQLNHIFGTFILFAGILFIGVQWSRQTREDKNMFWCVLVPALMGCIVTALTSRMTIYNSYITGLTGGIVAIFIICRGQRPVAWLSYALVLIYLFSVRWDGIYEDQAQPYLTQQIQSGPFRYLWTGPERAQTIEFLQQDLKQLPADKSIMFKDHFPAGYMMTNLRPAGPTLNILPLFYHPEARPIYRKIYEDPSNLADYIVELRAMPLGAKSEWLYLPTDPQTLALYEQQDPFLDFFMRSGKYKVELDRNVYRILKKIDSAR